MEMERIVFFGKGGIGKSTTASNVSATLGARGVRVLHVGCDPKHDSTAALLNGTIIRPVVDSIAHLEGVTPEQIVTRSRHGIDCVEAGGPQAGVGCGGRGISRMLEIFAAAKLLTSDRYDVAIYDVLGDVVCGGFAAPLRVGIGQKVVIVASEEVMSLYAANNIARAIVHYADNGIVLAGMLVNLRDNDVDRGPVERFSKIINAPILAYIPRDSLVRDAEYAGTTVVDLAPKSRIAAVYREIADAILATDPRALTLPRPLTEAQFYQYTRRKFHAPPTALDTAALDTTRAVGPSGGVLAVAHGSRPWDEIEAKDPDGSTAGWLIAGSDSRRQISRALGFPARFSTGAVCRVASVQRGRAAMNTLRVVVAVDELEDLTLMLQDGHDEKAAMNVGGMSVRYRGKTASPALQAVIRRIAARARGFTVPALCAMFSSAESTTDATAGDLERPDSLAYSFGSPLAWRLFVEGREQYRGYYGRLSGNVVAIHHTDLECEASNLPPSARTVTFFNYLTMEPDLRRIDGLSLTTDLSDVDVIKGGSARLERVLEAIGASNVHPEAVVIKTACVPIVTGDDVRTTLRRVGKHVSLPVLDLGNAIQPVLELLRRLRAQSGFLDVPKRPGAVNLVGLPRATGYRELLAFMESCDMPVNCWLIPDVDPVAFRGYMAASLQVFFDGMPGNGVYDDFQTNLPLETLRMPGPFGLEGTRHWLATIADRVGRRTLFDACWAERMKTFMPSWERSVREASSVRLGFVMEPAMEKALTTGEGSMGVPVLPVLHEMGFRFDLARYSASACEPRWTATDARGTRRATFRDASQLESLLRSSEAPAFYSQIYFDRRLSRSGKSAFSLRAFALGLDGAQRTIEKILALCRLPFYRTFGAYLGPAFTPFEKLAAAGERDGR